jgi:hypothetical protein
MSIEHVHHNDTYYQNKKSNKSSLLKKERD